MFLCPVNQNDIRPKARKVKMEEKREKARERERERERGGGDITNKNKKTLRKKPYKHNRDEKQRSLLLWVFFF